MDYKKFATWTARVIVAGFVLYRLGAAVAEMPTNRHVQTYESEAWVESPPVLESEGIVLESRKPRAQ